MSDYIHKFNNYTDFHNAYEGNSYEEPWVSKSNNSIITEFTTTGMRYSTNDEIDEEVATFILKEVRRDGDGEYFVYATQEGNYTYLFGTRSRMFSNGNEVEFWVIDQNQIMSPET